MLHELLASTLADAFLEWRAVATEKAHWRRVSMELNKCFTYLKHMQDSQLSWLLIAPACCWAHKAWFGPA
jgi:hypothetical protein